MKIRCKNFSGFISLLLIHILIISSSFSLCCSNEMRSTTTDPTQKKNNNNIILISRKLLLFNSMASVSSGFRKFMNGGSKKAVEQSLRKAPPSLANPIQNEVKT
ncbi:putative Transmembrane protein [Melia azedarach]|uniref:Transmembrane protein n=1 Tax=Melia azedarach TaxID=155640 RepID=A0ACC1X3R9_MELAZ|nr:putative Transmembrane protein [Melia azedarach]